MNLNHFNYPLLQTSKHKVFISYHHTNDEYYRLLFETLFGNIFINKSVRQNDIDTDVSTEYIKRLIQKNYISDSSVVVVLVGSETYCRKHVDWEIAAGLMKKVGGYSGILGLHLPTHPDYGSNHYNENNVPLRLARNIQSGYAKIYDWADDADTIKARIEDAFNARISRNQFISNIEQFKYNRSPS